MDGRKNSVKNFGILRPQRRDHHSLTRVITTQPDPRHGCPPEKTNRLHHYCPSVLIRERYIFHNQFKLGTLAILFHRGHRRCLTCITTKTGKECEYILLVLGSLPSDSNIGHINSSSYGNE